MLLPYRLKVTRNHGLVDPLSSDQCQIEQRILDHYEPVGGYYFLEIENLPTIACSKIEHSYEKILRILGINPY